MVYLKLGVIAVFCDFQLHRHGVNTLIDGDSFHFRMSKLQPSRLVAFDLFKTTIERKMIGWKWFALNWQRKEMRNNENMRIAKVQSLVSLSLQLLPSRILYVNRQTDCVACRAVCARWRWSLYQVYQRFSFVPKTILLPMSFVAIESSNAIHQMGK
jgi:hypothetical protein